MYTSVWGLLIVTLGKVEGLAVFPCEQDFADNPTRACLAFHVLLPAVISFSGAKTITFFQI